MLLHELRTWTQPSVCQNFVKISPSHLFVPTTTTSLHYPTFTCLPLPQSSPSQLYPIKVSAFSLPASSFPAHSAHITDIPLTCLQYPSLLPICVALALSGLNSSFCLAPSSLFSLGLYSGVFSGPSPTWPYFLAPACFLAPPASPWPPSLV